MGKIVDCWGGFVENGWLRRPEKGFDGSGISPLVWRGDKKTMAKDKAYRRAENKIAEAKHNNAKDLWLTCMGLTELPEAIGQLSQLRELSLSANQLRELPEAIAQLTELQTLYLDNNHLREFAEAIGQLRKLRELYLHANQLTELPEAVGQLTQLLKLTLSVNQLRKLSKAIGQLTQLQVLHLEINNLTKLPDAIGELTQLKHLTLHENQLTELPEVIGQLTQLKNLTLDENQLTSLPHAIGQLTQLKNLTLDKNRLTSLPQAIGQLTQLRELLLNENQLTELPEAIGQLARLQMLFLNDNQLTELPEAISQLTKLKRLNLYGNDELGIPPEVLGGHWGAGGEDARPGDIIEYYFRQRKEVRRELREAKVLLVGQGGVGKTSLVNRLIDGEYDPDEGKTEGINIREWEVAGKEREGEKAGTIKLNVWDFGGQEIMHATHQFFLTKRSLYILVLDARKGENDCNIQYWLKIIQSYGGDSPVLVVTNQCDQDFLELNENRLKKDYAPNIKGFFATSCKDGSGIEELRGAIEKEINELAHVYDVLPKSYFDIKGKLEGLAESRNFIDIEDYRGICREHTVDKEEEQNVLLRFLHDLGNVLNFGDPEDPYQLRDTNILNPEWVTEGVYKIINDRGLKEQKDKGVLAIGKMGVILEDKQRYPKKRHGFIIDMMRKFELCFDFPEGKGQRVLIPELLGRNEPGIDWNAGESLNFEYHYSVLPSGLICRFIVRMHSKVTKHRIYWRSGVLMDVGKNIALVRGDTDSGKIFISVGGPEETRKDALKVIRDELKAIHATVPRLDVKEKVPLAEEAGIVVDYAHLLRLREAGEENCWPEGAERSYKVKKLLEGVDLQRFDVFLCHNSEDKAGVKRIGEELKKRGLKVWLDEWELRPGLPWQRALEEQIESIKSAAVFVGESGMGPWQKMETEGFLGEFVERGCPVIPVILDGCPKEPKLPVFLRGFAWVDLRKGTFKEGIDKLEWGITGKKQS